MPVDPRILAALDAPLQGTPSARPFKAKGGAGSKSGYAATPGTGPAGESCGSCRHLVHNCPGNRAYLKCGLINWSRGAATDVRSKSPACSRWESRHG